MPSKKSRSLKKAVSPSSVERIYSEAGLPALAEELLTHTGPRAWFFLEGELGAGKSALAAAMLRRLGHAKGGEGSPTFPLAHEYTLSGKKIAHLDLYRIGSEPELEMTGLLEHFSGQTDLVIIEWASLFNGVFDKIKMSASDLGVSVVEIQIELDCPGEEEGQPRRRFKIRSSRGSALRDTGSPRRSGRA